MGRLGWYVPGMVLSAPPPDYTRLAPAPRSPASRCLSAPASVLLLGRRNLEAIVGGLQRFESDAVRRHDGSWLMQPPFAIVVAPLLGRVLINPLCWLRLKSDRKTALPRRLLDRIGHRALNTDSNSQTRPAHFAALCGGAV